MYTLTELAALGASSTETYSEEHNKMTKVYTRPIRRVDIYTDSGHQTWSFEEFRSLMNEYEASTPAEYRDTLAVEIDSYDIPYENYSSFELKIFYRRPYTDEEFAEHVRQIENNEKALLDRKKAMLESLKKELGVQ